MRVKGNAMNKYLLSGALALVMGLTGTAAVTPARAQDAPALQQDETAEGFDLDALVAAAKKEGPITIYDESGRIVPIAEAFTAKYGIAATGIKLETGALDKIRRESMANNPIADVLAISDPPSLASELMKDGIVVSWIPGDTRDAQLESVRYPLLLTANMLIWTYNNENQTTCPIKNIWELTEEKWASKVAVGDFEARSLYTNWFNQAARNQSEAYAKAFEEYYGKPLETDEPSAFHEWLKRFAQNSPTVLKSDTEAANSVGAAGQKDPPMGLMHVAVFRYNKGGYADKGYHIQACADLKPFLGTEVPQAMVYTAKSKNVNAAKLFIHFALSQEGLDFVMPDGRLPYRSGITLPKDDWGLIALRGQLQAYDTSHLEDDYNATSTWQDFWRSNRN